MGQDLYRKVLSRRDLTDAAFVLRFERQGMKFSPGQYVTVGPSDCIHIREYSIYSSPHEEDYIEVLVKRVDDGEVTPKLAKLSEGDAVKVQGPFGFFTLPEDWETKKFLFISTGTGVSPMHNFISTYANLDYKLLHGVRNSEELYEKHKYDNDKYVACVSGSVEEGDIPLEYFSGRVTKYLQSSTIDPDTLCYLCGNCDMIYEAFDILRNQGVPSTNLFAEVYF